MTEDELQVLKSLNNTLRGFDQSMRRLGRLLRLQMRSTYSLKDVRRLWPGWSESKVKEAFRLWAKHKGSRTGVAWEASLAQVMAVQAAHDEGHIA